MKDIEGSMGKDQYCEMITNFDPNVKGPDGEDINLNILVEELSETSDIEEQKKHNPNACLGN